MYLSIYDLQEFFVYYTFAILSVWELLVVFHLSFSNNMMTLIKISVH